MTGQALPKKLTLCEVGPRDGLQNESTLLSVTRKVELIERMVVAGARVIEIGSFVHPKAVPAMADTDEVAKALIKTEGVEYRALVLNKKGLERASAAGVSKVKLTVSASPTHSRQNSNATPQEMVQSFADCAAFAADNGVVLSGAIATAFGYYAEGVISLDLIRPIVDEYLKFGVRELSLSDSTGFANPAQVYDYFSTLRQEYGEVTWTLHAHNTRGMGMANIYAALQAGISHFDASFGGIGGCPFAPGASGNVATEDVVNMANAMGIETGINIDDVISVAVTLREWLGHELESSMLRVAAPLKVKS